MSFDLLTIAIFSGLALLYALVPTSWRGWTLLILSVFGIYWLQPSLPIRFADFILPTITLGLTVASWQLTATPAADAPRFVYRREDWRALLLIVLVMLGMALMRYLPMGWRLTPSRPPPLPWLLVAIVAMGGLFLLLRRATRRLSTPTMMAAGMGVIVLIFVLLKTQSLAVFFARLWRLQTGQDPSLASIVDWRWLGFSYVAFRLIHTFRDRQLGLLPALSLREYVAYALFFPAFIAGPIDRAERFVIDFRALQARPSWDVARFGGGSWRILTGLVKKFVIADSLALGLTLTSENVFQVESTWGLWLLLYGYALRLYFDFSGYTDIAIGLGILFGVQLPENFRRPYLQTNITRFWQCWHITLSDWARFYVFIPLSRSLLRRKPRPSPILIVLIAQLATMAVIGLWHGVAGNFLIWGLWHGLGLFVHKQWSDRSRQWYRSLQGRRWTPKVWAAVTWLITFHFVVLGWVWFMLPSPRIALVVLLRLFGFGWTG